MHIPHVLSEVLCACFGFGIAIIFAFYRTKTEIERARAEALLAKERYKLVMNVGDGNELNRAYSREAIISFGMWLKKRQKLDLTYSGLISDWLRDIDRGVWPSMEKAKPIKDNIKVRKLQFGKK